MSPISPQAYEVHSNNLIGFCLFESDRQFFTVALPVFPILNPEKIIKEHKQDFGPCMSKIFRTQISSSPMQRNKSICLYVGTLIKL